MAQLFFKLNY